RLASGLGRRLRSARTGLRCTASSTARSAGPGSAQKPFAECRSWLGRPDKDVLLLAQGQFQGIFRREILESDDAPVVQNLLIVEPDGAALDMPARLAVGGGKPSLHEERKDAHAGFKFCTRQLNGRQVLGGNAFLKGLARRLGCLLGRRSAVKHGRDLGGQDLLGLVYLCPAQCCQPRYLIQRQGGVELQEAANVRVLGIAPILP